MPKFRKKPVVIEAVLWEGFPEFGEMLGPEASAETARMEKFDSWLKENQGDRKCRYRGQTIVIPTLEGEMIASKGDWIIRGVQGELYPCKPDIFEVTYEAEDTPPPSSHVGAETWYRWRGPRGGWIFDTNKPTWLCETVIVQQTPSPETRAVGNEDPPS